MKLSSVAAFILLFLQVRQSPTGIIEGVVTRKDGTTALSGVHIEIEEGFPSARLGRPFGAEATTDRGGRFTVGDVPAGEFEVTASLEGYLGRAQAKVVLSPGQRRQIVLALTPGATIRGRVTDSDDHPVSSVRVQILQQYTDEVGQRQWTSPGGDRDRAETNAEGSARSHPLHDNSTSGRVDPVTGRFEIRAPAGAYDLLAGVDFAQERYNARIPVDIRDHDIDDVAVVFSPGVEVRARLVVDGDPQDLFFSSSDVGGDKRRSANIAVVLKGNEAAYPNRVVVDESGDEIRFRNVPEGTYEVSVSIEPGSVPLNPDFFVEDVRVAGRSVYDSGLRVGLDPTDAVEIVVGTKGGSIEGTIPQKGKTAAILILIPDSFRRNNAALYKREVIPASNEKVMLRGIAPGNYRIFAVPDAGQSLPFRSPEFAARYESRAVPVTVQKGAAVGPIQVPLLPLGEFEGR